MIKRLFSMLCLMLLPASVCAIGTLFYSPGERKAHETTHDQTTHDEMTHVYKINGIVLRSAGKSVVWINGSPVLQDDLPKLGIFRDHVVLDGLIIKAGESKDIPSGPPQSRSRP